MKQFIVSIALLSLPFVLPSGQQVSYAGEPQVFRIDVSADGGGEGFAWVSSDGKYEIEAKEFHFGGGWLGVQIGDVPEALAAQLGIDERSGILVLNVVKDSPADQAGLKVHDVIVAIDDEEVQGNVRRLVELVQLRKSGESVPVQVLRNSNKMTVDITLGTKPSSKMEWKFKTEPNTEIEERVHTRAKILGKGPGGKVIIRDVGDLDELENLPKDLQVMISKLDNQSTRVFVDGEQKRVEMIRESDGTTLKIEQVDDGEIIVTRTGEEGNETKTVYNSKEQLETADAEAFELLESTSGNIFVQLQPLDGHKIFEFDVEHLGDGIAEWREEFEQRLAEAREALNQARAETGKVMKEMFEQLDPEELDALHKLKENQWFSNSGLSHFVHIGKPKHSFEVESDGSIKVRIRNGDTELVRTFANEDDLQKRDPRLYEKYLQIIEVDTEE